MRILAYPPYDTILGTAELELDANHLTLWQLLQNVARKYPAFQQELPDEASDEALRARLLPIGDGHIYSVNDLLPANATIKLFPPVSGG